MQPSSLRVALFTGNYNYVRDGPAQAMNRLVGYLLEQGAAVRIYSPTTKNPAVAAVGDLVSVPSVPMAWGRGEYRVALGLPAVIRRDISVFRPNIVHIATPDIMGHRALSYAARNKIPSVASLHTRFETYPRYYGLAFLEPLFERFLTRFYNRADQVLVPTNSMGALLRSWGVETPISIWSRGVDGDNFNPVRRSMAWRRENGIADDDFALGFLGRLVKEKGLKVYCEVVRVLAKEDPSFKALIVGDGPARAWLEEQLPRGRFVGFKSGIQLGEAIASMDVFLNPSVTETFGNVTLEAFSAGVPVVAALATGAQDLIENGIEGMLIAPNDIAGYVDALRRIKASPQLREQMQRNARHKAADFKWDVVNRAVMDSYLELHSSSGALATLADRLSCNRSLPGGAT